MRNVLIWACYNFSKPYASYHLMEDLIQGLLISGDSVILIEPGNPKSPSLPPTLCDNKNLKAIAVPLKKSNKSSFAKRYIYDLIYYHRSFKIIKKSTSPDVIFLQSSNNSFYPLKLAKKMNCTVIYNEQDIFPDDAVYAGLLTEKSLIYKLTHYLQFLAYKTADTIITISEDMKSTIISYGISANKVKVIYNWGHEDFQIPSDNDNLMLKKYPKENNEFRVVYSGNIGKIQNVELIIKTAELLAENRDIKFYIIGNGVSKKKLMDIAIELKLSNIIFLDFQPDEYISSIYAMADVNLIPLKEHMIYLSLPSKTADCLLAGKPIICCFDSESNLVKMLFEHGIKNVNPTDEKGLSEEIISIKNNEWKAEPHKILEKYFSKNISVSEYCKMINGAE